MKFYSIASLNFSGSILFVSAYAQRLDRSRVWQSDFSSIYFIAAKAIEYISVPIIESQ